MRAARPALVGRRGVGGLLCSSRSGRGPLCHLFGLNGVAQLRFLGQRGGPFLSFLAQALRLFSGKALFLLAPLALSFGNLALIRSAEYTSELQSLMRISYAVFFLNK